MAFIKAIFYLYKKHYDFRNNGETKTKNIVLITNEDTDDANETNINSTFCELESGGIQLHGV